MCSVQMQDQGNMQGPFPSMAMMGGGCQASGPMGGGGIYGPAQAMTGGKGGQD